MATHGIKGYWAASPYWHWAECICGAAFDGSTEIEAGDALDNHIAELRRGSAPTQLPDEPADIARKQRV